MKLLTWAVLVLSVFAWVLAAVPSSVSSSSDSQTFDITTLAGKVASVNSAQGLHLRVSSFIEQEAEVQAAPAPDSSAPITPTFVLSSPLDGASITPPTVAVNRDLKAAPQNEPAIAVDPGTPNRIVVGMNDYVTRAWSCTIGATPCSALGDGYSGTYYSNDGGATWCCVATDPSHLGTLIPGVERLTGGLYDAGGDPSVAFDSHGHVFYAGLGFDRLSSPNTVTVSRGTFDANGALSWGAPTFLNPTTSPSIFNDKEWIGIDTHAASPFQDRIYVSWTRFIFNPITGRYVQSPIMFAFSSDGGATFSDPSLIVGNVLYDQGSRVVVGPDGTVYVFWEGSTRRATFNSIWVAASTDGGATFGRPVEVSPLADIISPANTVFRVNSFPAADIAPDGTLYTAWSSEVRNDATAYDVDPTCTYFIAGPLSVYAHCHASAVWSKSTDGGATWSAPEPILTVLDGATRTAVGYPARQPNGTTLNAPDPRRVDSFWPGVSVSTSGRVYMSAYAADVVSPWQLCKTPATPRVVGRINCLELDSYVHNARLDYVVADLTTGTTRIVTTHPINSRHQFGGTFIGDYTGIAVGSDDVFHAVWTDTNSRQSLVWWYGFQFASGTMINQQDIVVASGSF
jgi:hypothetical protein